MGIWRFEVENIEVAKNSRVAVAKDSRAAVNALPSNEQPSLTSYITDGAVRWL